VTAFEQGKFTVKAADGTIVDRGNCEHCFVCFFSHKHFADVIVWKHVDGKWLMHRDSFNSEG